MSNPEHPNAEPSERAPTLGHRSISRRTFLQASLGGVGVAASSTVPASAAAAMTSTVRRLVGPQPIGLQLYTVRDLMDSNFEYALQQVAHIGYREVEFAGLFDHSPKRVAQIMSKVGLTSPSSHIGLDRLTSNLQGVVEEAKALGNEFVVCPSVDAARSKDATSWRRVAAEFNRIGESLQRVGLRFAFHNHDIEFKPLPGGEIGYDILLDECDPKLVKMELDLYWITKARRDPLTYFAKWPSRFPLVHVKDMSGNGAMANVGQGHIDWGRIFDKRREAGVEHFLVERDNPSSPIEDITASYAYMSRLGL